MLQNGAWVKVENSVRWKDLPNSRVDIRPVAAKAIFRFESQLVAAGAQVLRTINVISEHNKKGTLIDSDIIIKNGRIVQLSAADARTLVNIAMCVQWPILSRAGNCAGMQPSGGHFGPYRRQNMKDFGCVDLSSLVPDIIASIEDLMRPHLRHSQFHWNATFIGIGCQEIELLQLPSEGYTFVQVVHNPGGGTVTNLSTKTVLRSSGQGMMVRLCDIHIEGGRNMCFLVLYHSFVEHSAQGRSPLKR